MPQVGFGAGGSVLVGSMVGEGVAVSVGVDVVVSTELDVAVSAGVEIDDADGVDVDVVVSTWLDVSDGVGVADDEVFSDGVELELEMTSALEELCDETAEDVGVVGVVDVAMGAEFDDSDAVGIAEDEDSDSTRCYLRALGGGSARRCAS
jgi:hypothetical protein